MEVLVDTSFIITCLRKKIDFLDIDKFGNIVIFDSVINELKRLSKDKRKKEKDRELGKVAIQIIEKNKDKIKIINKNGNVDKEIILYAKEKRVIVATIDKELRKKLKGTARLLGICGKKIMLI